MTWRGRIFHGLVIIQMVLRQVGYESYLCFDTHHPVLIQGMAGHFQNDEVHTGFFGPAQKRLDYRLLVDGEMRVVRRHFARNLVKYRAQSRCFIPGGFEYLVDIADSRGLAVGTGYCDYPKAARRKTEAGLPEETSAKPVRFLNEP
jgi:hypothetical protein